MSLLGFDAIGRFAIGQNPISGNLPAIYGGSFGIWAPAVHPRNFSKDWVAFADNISVNAPKYTQPFSPFLPPPRPRNFAKDWIAFSGDIFVETRTLSFFTGFSQPPKPPHLAKDWIAYSGSEQTEDFPTFGIDFLPFSPGRAAKLWSGQSPQWWPYYLNAPFFPSGRDTHDGLPRRSWHRRHPPVYEQEYYDELLRKWKWEHPDEEPPESIVPPPVRVPNLLIPLSRLIRPTAIPTLTQLPPYRPVPTLTQNPPAFHMATPEEMKSDDEMIIRMLLEE